MAISGNATTAEGLPADFVRIFNWPTGALSAVVTPDQSGNWSYQPLSSGDYGITYMANGCQPITHGPYYVEVVYSPGLLFEGQRRGLWFDIEPQYLFQDAAGTIPVQSDGDPVGLVIDRSGNGHNAKQTNPNNRPIFKQIGERRWLSFNGVSQRLSIDGFEMGGSPTISIAITLENLFTGSATQMALEAGEVWDAVEGSFAIHAPRYTPRSASIVAYQIGFGGTASTLVEAPYSQFSPPRSDVIFAGANIPQSKSELYVNGSLIATSSQTL